MADEHFGTAVAEMVRGGCIGFAPNGGGQVEIVGRDERLLYDNMADGVAKIGAVLSDPGAQANLHADLVTKAAALSAERFVREIRELVRDF